MRDRLLPPLWMTLLPIGCKGDIRFAANLQGIMRGGRGRKEAILGQAVINCSHNIDDLQGEQCEARGGRPGVHWRGGIH